jgi:NADH-quinone oxidoreductase subunit E
MKRLNDLCGVKMSSVEKRSDVDEFIKDLITTQKFDKTRVIGLLQKTQEKFRYLPEEAFYSISKNLKIPLIDALGVATFYKQFRFTKPGKHTIKICEGTACHVRRGTELSEAIEQELGIKPGETTEDGLFSLERVACLGCCALAPVMVIDDKVYGSSKPAKMKKIVQSMKSGK